MNGKTKTHRGTWRNERFLKEVAFLLNLEKPTLVSLKMTHDYDKKKTKDISSGN
jgi:hypothetical protein